MREARTLVGKGGVRNDQVDGMSRPDEVQYVQNQKMLVDLISRMEVVTRSIRGKKLWEAGIVDWHLQYPCGEGIGQDEYAEKIQVLKVTDEYKGSAKRSSRGGTDGGGQPDYTGTEKKGAFFSYLLQEKLNDSLRHLERLLLRITDNRSKVLVTGDLNSGKSTLVNAILKHSLLPSDQQPCTLMFAEVIDSARNDNVEEIHCIYPGVLYKSSDPTTYVKSDIGNLQSLLEENREGFERLKLYYDDKRCSTGGILKSELIEITLIDSPGLNIDTAKTTALFAKQEEIDAIVFVVNAENHFTLSGREFLETAGKEKAYIFIVINKFDAIKNKERCKNMILKQIKDISPLTHKELESLVHFVSAKYRIAHILGETIDNEDLEYPNYQVDFIHLEECLSSFILEKRSRSKLAPVKIYLDNLASDLTIILKYNLKLVEDSISKHRRTVKRYTPEFHSMSLLLEKLNSVDLIVEEGCSKIEAQTKESLRGLVDNIDSFTNLVEWKSIYSYKEFGESLCTMLRDTSAYFIQNSFEDIHPFIEKYNNIIMDRCETFIKIHSSDDKTRLSKLLNQIRSLRVEGARTDSLSLKKSSFLPLHGSLDDIDSIIMSELKNNFRPQNFAREYSPSAGMMLLGALFSRYYIVRRTSTSYQSVRSQSNDATNIFILALITSGIAIFMYRLSNMKNKIRRNVIGRMKDYVEKSVYISESS